MAILQSVRDQMVMQLQRVFLVYLQLVMLQTMCIAKQLHQQALAAWLLSMLKNIWTSYNMILRSSQPIGIFDSGVGGLTVAHAVTQLLPHENIIYFGDVAHHPYGEKSTAAIQAYTIKI